MDGGTLRAIETDLTSLYAQHLEGLEHRLDAVFAAAEAALKDLATRANTATDDFVNGTKHVVDAIDAGRRLVEQEFSTAVAGMSQATHFLDDVEKRRADGLQAVEASLQQLERTLQSIEQNASTAFTSVTQETQTLVQSLDDGATKTHDAGAQISQTLGEVDQRFLADVQDMIAALRELARQIETDHQQQDTSSDQHAQNVQTQTMQTIQTNIHSLSEGMHGVQAAFSLLEQVGDKFGGDFKNKVHDIVAVVNQVSQLIDKIEPVLRLVQELA